MYGFPTVLTSWAVVIARLLEQAGLDVRKTFLDAGLDPELLRDPNARYPVSGTAELWRSAVEATGDEAIGVHASANVSATTFHALGYSLAASGSLQEALNRVVRYYGIVTDAAEISCERVGDCYRFVAHISPDRPRPAPQAIDAFMSLIVRIGRDLVGEPFPVRLALERPAPADRTPFDTFFGSEVRFGAEDNYMEIAASIVEKPLSTGNPELARINDQVVREYLARLDKENIANRVHVLLTQMLPSGTASQENVAKQMHMSLRSLQRKLAEEGVTYKSVLDDTRRELALSYLHEGGHSVNELTYLLGFSDSSSFARAFKRWTGKSPREYKATLDKG